MALVDASVARQFDIRGYPTYLRVGPTDALIQTFARVVDQKYAGKCPCGCGRPIVRDGRLIREHGKPLAEFDHFYHRAVASIHTGWILYKACNRERPRPELDAAYDIRWLRLFFRFQEACNGSAIRP